MIIGCVDNIEGIVTTDAAVHIVLGALHDHRGKGEHTDQVGDHHESVKGIGNIPCELRFHEASEKTYKRKDHAIGEDRLCPEQKRNYG
jgi:hypothetical protein